MRYAIADLVDWQNQAAT